MPHRTSRGNVHVLHGQHWQLARTVPVDGAPAVGMAPHSMAMVCLGVCNAARGSLSCELHMPWSAQVKLVARCR
jgi:hypothetical protein